MNASVRLLERTLPSSVTLRATIPESHPSAQILGAERMGSGIFVDAAGLILTVNYVVLGADSVEVTLVDETTHEAQVVAQDFHSGLALVRIEQKGQPAVRVSASPLTAGQEVFILASFGGAQRRVNTGAVSSLDSFEAFWEYRLEHAILTTAMNPGLGGGGLFTLDGSLAGIVSLDFNEVGRFTLAIPVEHYSEHRDELLRHGRRVTRPARAWVGVYCYMLREHVVIAGVVPGSPAERAGLKPGDVVIAVGAAKVSERRALYLGLWEHKPGEVVTLRVFRGNAVREIAVETIDVEAFFA
jgi:S1-C subfamily serine protease